MQPVLFAKELPVDGLLDPAAKPLQDQGDHHEDRAQCQDALGTGWSGLGVSQSFEDQEDGRDRDPKPHRQDDSGQVVHHPPADQLVDQHQLVPDDPNGVGTQKGQAGQEHRESSGPAEGEFDSMVVV